MKSRISENSSCKKIAEAAKVLREGLPVLIFDSKGREEEVDMVYLAKHVGYKEIYDLRVNAGGLICYATEEEVTRQLGIPYGYEIYGNIPSLKPLTEKVLGYGDRPAFTIWVNHISVKTGIRDKDKAKTIMRLHQVVEMVKKNQVDTAYTIFREEFVAPGHVPILAAKHVFERRGHTELSIVLANLIGETPSVVLAEMLDAGEALSLNKAEDIARRRGTVLLYGDDIIRCYEETI